MGLPLACSSSEVAPPNEVSYAAHTASCTFLLDDQGICRRIVMAPKGKRRESSRTAIKCVGAQYVASLDGSAAGGLVEMPRVGASMLFARVDERGRIALVRTGTVVSFESHVAEDPFMASPSVETSAPGLADLEIGRGSWSDPAEVEEETPEPDYYDPSERTQRIQALRQDEIDQDETDEIGNDLKTAEYQSIAPHPVRPSEAPMSHPSTLRLPQAEPANLDDSDTFSRPVAPPSRGILPRRASSSDSQLRTAANAAPAWAPEPARAPQAYGSDVQLTRHRRGG